MESKLRVQKLNIDHIPVLYVQAKNELVPRRLAIFQNGLGGRKEDMISFLEDIAQKGYMAMSFDKCQHGERSSESHQEVTKRCLQNIRRYGWYILGQTVLDTFRVIDWSLNKLDILPEIYLGGISMGGDVALSVAGIHPNISKVITVGSTPDWLRPGLKNPAHSKYDIQYGKPDICTQLFYECFNPITNLSRYLKTPPISCILGENDTQIPPENSERFKSMLADLSPEAAKNIVLRYFMGENTDHINTIRRSDEWWPELCNWWLD